MWWLVLVLVVSLIKPKIIWDGPQIMSLMGYHSHIKWGENTHPLWEAPLLRQYCTKGRESMLGPSTHALIQYAVLYCGSNVLTASIPCTLIPPQNGLLPGMVSQINPLFLKVFFFPVDLLQQQEKYAKQKKLIAFWQFLWTPRKACEIGKVDCFLAVCVNTTKHCSLLQRAGSGYQKPSWVKNEIKWKARKMRSKHC